MIESIYKAYKLSSGISTDTRKLKANSIFFALNGENFNANEFVLQALALGCLAAVADQNRPEFANNPNIYIVDDTLIALQNLANFHRQNLKIPIVALTGSNGKTTTKELLKAALSEQYKCYATLGNLNNHIGVPLSLLEINEEHEIAVIEMGANHQGEIAELCRIAEPDFGLITNIGLAHLEGFGGPEGVYIGKKELFDYLKSRKNLLFVNADDEKIERAAADSSAVRYGKSSNASVQGVEFLHDGKLAFTWWTLTEPGIKITVNTMLSGSYNFSNALAAVAVAQYFGVSALKIKRGLEGYVPENKRSQIEISRKGNTIIIDCYNANPSSMAAAINSLKGFQNQSKICILGDMMELGESSSIEHEKIISILEANKIEYKILIGEHFYNVPEHILNSTYKRFQTTYDALTFLKESTLNNSTVLLKGSRKMKLETLLDVL